MDAGMSVAILGFALTRGEELLEYLSDTWIPSFLHGRRNNADGTASQRRDCSEPNSRRDSHVPSLYRSRAWSAHFANQIRIRSMPGTAGQALSSKLIASLARSYSLVVRGDSWFAILLRVLNCTTILLNSGSKFTGLRSREQVYDVSSRCGFFFPLARPGIAKGGGNGEPRI